MFAAVLALALFAAPAALAGNFYVGGAVGQTSTDIDDPGIDGIDVDDSDTGFKVFGGYSFMKHFAVEGGYVDVGETSIETTVPFQSEVSAEADGFTVGAVGILPIGQKFDLFAKAGFFMWDSEATVSMQGFGTESASDDGSDPTYGLGFGWNLSERSRLRFEADRYEVEDLDIDTYLVGYAFSF
jgi:OOP family OmpA-OmpF porin